jgi:hypothetical protein
MLRVWNTRTIRLDGHLPGEWKFASHRQLVEWGAATSERTSEDVLRRLSGWQEGRENANLVEKRKAHLGKDKNKLHLRPSQTLLTIMERLQLCRHEIPDNKEWSDFLKYVCEPIAGSETEFKNAILRRIARCIRSDKLYGKSNLTDDLASITLRSAKWAEASSTKSVVHEPDSTAKCVVQPHLSTTEPVVTDLATSKPFETGGLETGLSDKGPSKKETEEFDPVAFQKQILKAYVK